MITAADPSNVVQNLAHTLLKVFDETRDLFHTLKTKERRDTEHSLWSKGYSISRRLEHIEDEALGGDEAIVTDKAAVTRQFEIGCQDVGPTFAVGDVISQTALQSQIIGLQTVLINALLYGPSASISIAHQLSTLIAASRACGTTSVDVLAAQSRRQRSTMSPIPQSSQSSVPDTDTARAPSYPMTGTGAGSMATSLVRYQEPPDVRRGTSMNTTVLDWKGKPKMDRTDTDTTSMTGPTSYGMKSAPHDLHCLYAIELQTHRLQQLATSITSDPVPYCPHCKNTLHLSSGKAWEVHKHEGGDDRIFQISNRFVVKCHRDGADGQYICVLCSDHADVISVCGDVKALIRHIWQEHSVSELKHEEDITEVVDLPVDKRRDSGLGYSSSRSSRRSASLGPSQRRNKSIVEREVDVFEFRLPRR